MNYFLICHSILYQRGLYPPEMFKTVRKYGLSLLVTMDDSLRRYLDGLLEQVSGKSNLIIREIRPSMGFLQQKNI
jgi:hypothetical protein